MADINDLKTAPAKATMNIVDPNLAASRKKPIIATLGDIKEEDTNNAPAADANRVSDAVDMVTANTESELLNDGTRVINPKDIPNIKDPNAPEPRIMEDEVKEQLHDVITRKQQEAREEIQQMIAESEINERLAEENGITFDENGNAIGEDGQAATLSEDDELEAALDVELANMSAGRLNPPHEDDHEYEKVDDEEFDKVMSDFDKEHGIEEGDIPHAQAADSSDQEYSHDDAEEDMNANEDAEVDESYSDELTEENTDAELEGEEQETAASNITPIRQANNADADETVADELLKELDEEIGDYYEYFDYEESHK